MTFDIFLFAGAATAIVGLILVNHALGIPRPTNVVMVAVISAPIGLLIGAIAGSGAPGCRNSLARARRTSISVVASSVQGFEGHDA